MTLLEKAAKLWNTFTVPPSTRRRERRQRTLDEQYQMLIRSLDFAPNEAAKKAIKKRIIDLSEREPFLKRRRGDRRHA